MAVRPVSGSEAVRPRPNGEAGLVYQIMLFAHALRLCYRARRLCSEPLSEVVRRLAAVRGLPHNIPPPEAWRAAARACYRMKWWMGGLDSCLSRSLVAGALVADRADVVVHIGFRSVKGWPHESADGHAWLTVSGEAAGHHDPENVIEQSYVRVFDVPLSRGRLPMSQFETLVTTLRGERYTLTKLADATGVLLNVDARVVYTLSETGVFLVEGILGGAATTEELVAALVTAFEVDELTATKDVTRFLEDLGARL